MRSEELVGWLMNRGYKDYFVREQIVRASKLDREKLFIQEGRCSNKKKDQVPLVVTFHPALNELRGIVEKLHAMLDASEEHNEAFEEQPLVVLSSNASLCRQKELGAVVSVANCIVKFAVSCQKVAVLNVMFQEGNILLTAILLVILQV